MSNFITCNNNTLTPEQILAALLTKDADGNVAIRTMLADACSENAIDCTKNALPLNANLLKAIGISRYCGKPALRLGISPQAVALFLGVESYPDLTTANVTESAGVIFFNVALAKLDITTA